jgi:PhnB protein
VQRVDEPGSAGRYADKPSGSRLRTARWTPDLLVPAPAGIQTAAEDELAVVRATPLDQARHDLVLTAGDRLRRGLRPRRPGGPARRRRRRDLAGGPRAAVAAAGVAFSKTRRAARTSMDGMDVITKLYPRLVVADAAGAIGFYVKALGAREQGERYTDEAGKVVHAELEIGGTTVAVKDEGDGDPAPTSLGGTPVILALSVTDADAVAEAMLAAGATVIYPIEDREYGERGGRLADPSGHQWMISQPL